MTQQSNDAHAARKPKGRSPSYPALDLEAAVERARQLYDQDRQHPTSVDTIAQHWGYKSLNGPAALTLAALKKFGLVADAGTGANRRASVTDLAVDILANPDAAARLRATQRAALAPTIHKDLWDKYGDASGVSDANLHWELTRERRFTESGAREFIPEYRATISYAQLLGSGAVPTQEDDPLPDPGDGHDEDHDEDEDEDPPPPDPKRRKRRMSTDTASVYTIPLVGPDVVIEGEFPLSEADWNQLLVILTAMKPGLVKDEVD